MVNIKSCDVRVLKKVDARAAEHGGVRRSNRGLMEVTMDYDPKNISGFHFDHHSNQRRPLAVKVLSYCCMADRDYYHASLHAITSIFLCKWHMPLQ